MSGFLNLGVPGARPATPIIDRQVRPSVARAAVPVQLKPFDKQAFAEKLREQAVPPFGGGRCAQFVRQALEAGGIDTYNYPGIAKEYGPLMAAQGFRIVPAVAYLTQIGDIAVFQEYGESFPYGHIQGWDGNAWVSDFVQPEFWPNRTYREAGVNVTLYRA